MGRGAFDFTIVFSGYDHDKHADFELVPRVIGKGGCNMLPFPRMGASARVCGQGSGICEVEAHGQNQIDEDETLQLVVCCSTSLGCNWLRMEDVACVFPGALGYVMTCEHYCG